MADEHGSDDRGPYAFFTLDDAGRYVATHFAQSAWSKEMLNGPAVVAACARSLEVAHGDPEFQPARLTVDLLAATGGGPLEISTEAVREGNRIRVADAMVRQEGRLVARATLVQLRRGEQPAGEVWRSGRRCPVPPAVADEPLELGAWPYFGSDAADGRGDDGSGVHWSSDMREHQGSGRKRYWQHPLPAVAGEPGTPFQRAATLAESTSLMAHWGSAGIGFINADLTVALARLPRTVDLGVEGDEHISEDGVAVGTATLYDREGPIGTGTVVAVSNAKRQIDFGSRGRDPRQVPESSGS